MKTAITWILIIVSAAVIAYCSLNDSGYVDGLIEGYHMGQTAQIKDNVKHGVMNEKYQWLDKYKLAR